MLEPLSTKVAGPHDCSFIKRSLQHRCFPVKFATFLRTPFLQDTSSGCFCNFQFGISFFHVARINRRGILISAFSFFLFHFANSIHCYNQILKKKNELLRFDGIDLNHRKSKIAKEFKWNQLYKRSFLKYLVEILIKPRYISAAIFGCYRILGLGKLGLESLDSREIRTSSLISVSSLFLPK